MYDYGFDQDDYDHYIDNHRSDYDEPSPRRRSRGCACGLDGYPGTCPGAEACPHSGWHDDEGEDE